MYSTRCWWWRFEETRQRLGKLDQQKIGQAMQLKFLDDRIYRMETPVKIRLGQYTDGSLAIFLAYDTIDEDEEMLWASATLFRGIPLEDKNTVHIKDDEENMRMADMLIRNGIIEREPVSDDGFGCPLYRLTPEFTAYASAKLDNAGAGII